MNCFKECLLGFVVILLGACETTTTGESTGTLSAALSMDDIITDSYELKTLLKPDDLPPGNMGTFAENGVLADGNRFFFIQDTSIYELTSQPDGTVQYETALKTKNCTFSGLTSHDSLLYAACTIFSKGTTKLYRVDLSLDESHPQRVASTRLYKSGFAPNGMAVDDRGDIFMSNSMGTELGMILAPANRLPVIIRVRVVDEENFTIKKKGVVPAGGVIGIEPNGLQIREDRLWLACENNLYEAEIVKKGLKGFHRIYQAKSSRFFDDFTVLPENIIALTEIPHPFRIGNMIGYPPENKPSKLLFVSTGPGPYSNKAGEVVEEYVFDPSIVPSSVALMEDEEGPAFYITDVLVGGIHLIRPVMGE